MVKLQFLILLVAHGFQPLVGRALAGDFHRNVGEPAVLLRAVPVLDLGRNDDDVAGPATHKRICPPPFVAWWMCQLLRQPGSNVTFAKKGETPAGVRGLR